MSDAHEGLLMTTGSPARGRAVSAIGAGVLLMAVAGLRDSAPDAPLSGIRTKLPTTLGLSNDVLAMKLENRIA
jgi:hypothetical protein